jgi:lipoprotein NlpD
VIEVGQVLRVIPPAGSSTEVAAARPVAPAPGTAAPASAASSPRPAATGAQAPVASLPPAANQPVPSAGEDDLAWSWPTSGAATVVAGFDEQRNKGLDIAGKPGDPVLASADGRVVYAGAGLRGYGNLIILKHNNTFLSAYAHNQALLVKEDQNVRKGQKIAEMGSSDADRVKLHFEIRRQGKPVDPARYLPPR